MRVIYNLCILIYVNFNEVFYGPKQGYGIESSEQYKFQWEILACTGQEATLAECNVTSHTNIFKDEGCNSGYDNLAVTCFENASGVYLLNGIRVFEKGF